MPTPGNSVNEQTTGITGFTGTAFVGTALTAHDVLVGGSTSSTITNVANGTTGQVLTANTGADPTWQSPASSFAPNATIQLFDDFMSGENSTTAYWLSQLTWYMPNVSFQAPAAVAGNPGLISNSSLPNTAILLAALINAKTVTNVGPMLVGGGVIQMNWVINVATNSSGTNRYILRFGFGDTFTAVDQVNGIYFEYSDNINSGNYTIKTSNASTRTTTNTSTATSAAFVNFGITINAAGTSVTYTINGSSVGTIATNIPSAAICPFYVIYCTAGTVPANSVIVDLFYMTQTLTTPR